MFSRQDNLNTVKVLIKILNVHGPLKALCNQQWAFVPANYLPLILSTKEVLLLPVSKHRYKDNNIYERDKKWERHLRL